MVIVLASVLGTRPGVALALHAVTWMAIALLALIAVSLHIRVQRLERLEARRDRGAAYGQFVGRRLEEVLDGDAPRPLPRLVLFLSPSCPSCERLVEELRAPGWEAPTALVWTGTARERQPEVPPRMTFVPGGPGIGERLGIRVTPFALVADETGTIIRATPINSLEPLHPPFGPRGAATVVNPR